MSNVNSLRVVEDITTQVKLQLGYPIVDVEIDDSQIRILINLALKELAKFSVLRLYKTINLTNKSIDASTIVPSISYIYDVYNSKASSDLTDTNNFYPEGIPLGVKSGSSLSKVSNLLSEITNLYNERVMISRQLSSFKDKGYSYDYDRETNKLYIDSPSGNRVTIEYIPILTMDDLEVLERHPEAYTVVLTYVTGYSLISLGRARGKFKTSNYDVSISSDELLQEGKDMIKGLNELLRRNYNHNVIE